LATSPFATGTWLVLNVEVVTGLWSLPATSVAEAVTVKLVLVVGRFEKGKEYDQAVEVVPEPSGRRPDRWPCHS